MTFTSEIFTRDLGIQVSPVPGVETKKPLYITLTSGTPLFIVGPNGSGKSSLIHEALTQLNGKRISANRQVWLTAGRIDTTRSYRMQYAQQLTNMERSADARWLEYEPASRWSVVLYDLVEKENSLSRRIADRAYDYDLEGIKAIVGAERRVFARINDLLKSSGFPITVATSDGDVTATHENSGLPFDIAKMSDGERSALLIAAEVLTAMDNSVLLIDEPERHLNRGITVPFLSALFAERPDCIFVVATHDIELPMSNPDAQTLLVRSCKWLETHDTSRRGPYVWDASLLKKEQGIPESIKREILGSRKKILFVEGKADFALYAALFPGVSVRSMGGRNGVRNAVSGVRNSEAHHHVRAFGLVDGDGRNDASELESEGVFALPCYSVESLYYCDDAIVAVARHQSTDHNDSLDAEAMVDGAKKAAIDSLKEESVAVEMVSQICERRVREEILEKIPIVEEEARENRSRIELRG